MNEIPKFDYPGPKRRVARVVAYMLWAVAGGILTANPSFILTGHFAGYVVYAWSVFMAVGGLACTLGALTDRWIGEYGGLWLVITSLWVFGGVLVTRGITGDTSFAGIAVGLLFISFGFKALGRWQDIRDLVQTQRERLRRNRQNGDA